ncbi:MAG TPA: hypothetical protein VIL85_03550, partial [Thermomicrobiales bacterium]
MKGPHSARITRTVEAVNPTSPSFFVVQQWRTACKRQPEEKGMATILVVEDETDINNLIRSQLEAEG